MTLRNLRDALLKTGIPVDHFEARGRKDRYIVWSEDGQSDAAYGDGRMAGQTLTGTVDLYTKTEYDRAFACVQAALNGLGLGWRLNSIQREPDTKYIHYEWVWEGVFSDGADDF